MKHVLVCLHGWGGTKESFTELRIALKDAPITVLTPDLPGFGSEPEPKKPWTTDDYADWVEQWIKKEMENGPHFAKATRGRKWKMENGGIHLLGHSHGGRIALKLAARQSQRTPIFHFPFSIFHLYLCAAAGIRHPRHFRRIIGLTLAKTGKVLLGIPGLRSLTPIGKKLLYKLVRVHDYEQASPVLRQTLINVSAEDLRPLLKTIDIPTDIFWGTDDRMTPFSDALIMEREIRGSRLHSFEGVRHRVHRDRAAEIAAVIQGRMSLR